MSAPDDLPLSRVIDVRTLPSSGRTLDVTATDAECAALATFLGVEAVLSLTAALEVLPLRGKGVNAALSGRFKAVLRQACSVTLEPFEVKITDTLARRFTDREPVRSGEKSSHAGKKVAEVEVFVEDDDEPDLLDKGCLDAGRVVTEELALRVDPFARCDGVQFDWSDPQMDQPS